MEAQTSTRIVLLGKTGVGKSSLANTILGQDLFPVSHSPISDNTCPTETKTVNGKPITVIETPGLFASCESEESLKEALIKCITDCAPGPHAFLILLKIEKHTIQEKEVIEKISQGISEEAFKFATLVFTHGDQLAEGTTIEEFTNQNEALADLVRKCGGRCHVIDNKYWKKAGRDQYRNNQFQVAQILRTINKIQGNADNYYTNEMLETVEKDLKEEEDNLMKSVLVQRPLAIRANARVIVFKMLRIKLAGATFGAIFGGFLGVCRVLMVSRFSVADVTMAAQTGAMRGAAIGFRASEGANNAMEAIGKAWDSLNDQVD